ncbi:hypothetical protein Hypma_002952 [Hypsizygus marmoreus]|uniref:Uncharacterized protein n=1 Tax=Hypsizygus marmoreus TaxID=39966 RepID=A0A369J523_HYPMA|nr:hypothetical protein Hypma_002952 [Hypsizygus marmoreus]
MRSTRLILRIPPSSPPLKLQSLHRISLPGHVQSELSRIPQLIHNVLESHAARLVLCDEMSSTVLNTVYRVELSLRSDIRNVVASSAGLDDSTA